MLVRSGLSILMDHPRLYFNSDCTPGTEWLRFTPLEFRKTECGPRKPMRAISLPVGAAGISPHDGSSAFVALLDVYGFIITGLVFVICPFLHGPMAEIDPDIMGLAPWLEHVCPLRKLPASARTEWLLRVQPLQQLAYAANGVRDGAAFDPDGYGDVSCGGKPFPLVRKTFWRQTNGPLDPFMLLNGYVAFFIVHVTLVVVTGFRRNMNHIVLGADDQAHRNDFGFDRYRGRRVFLDSGALHLVAIPADPATSAKNSFSPAPSCRLSIDLVPAPTL